MTSVKKKIAVLISGNGSNLQAIIHACGYGLNASIADDHRINAETYSKIDAEICLVISNKRDAYGLIRAELAGINHLTIPSKGYYNNASHEMALIKALDHYHPDLIVLAGYMKVLTPLFVNHYAGIILNIHPSLLPNYPGLHTHQRAIDHNDPFHGASVHFVTEELDGGPVLIQSKVPITSDDNAQTLAQKVQQQEYKIYPQVIKWFIEGRIQLLGNKAIFDGQEVSHTGINHSFDLLNKNGT